MQREIHCGLTAVIILHYCKFLWTDLSVSLSPLLDPNNEDQEQIILGMNRHIAMIFSFVCTHLPKKGIIQISWLFVLVS